MKVDKNGWYLFIIAIGLIIITASYSVKNPLLSILTGTALILFGTIRFLTNINKDKG